MMIGQPNAQISKSVQCPAPRRADRAVGLLYISLDKPAIPAHVNSDLYAAIQDTFNKYGVQIMSPNYFEDPEKPKIVPESEWFASPAKREHIRPAGSQSP